MHEEDLTAKTPNKGAFGPKTRTGRVRVIFWALFALAVAIYLLGGFMERRLLFFPFKTLDGTPESVGLKFETVWLQTADGVTLHAWWVPHPRARATLLFSHGNAGNISHRFDKLRILHDLQVGQLHYDYRGYGQSRGSPSEEGLYTDAQAAYHWLLQEKKIPKNQIVAYGESLGGAVSAHLAARNDLGGLILDSAFTCVPDMARHHYALLAPLARLRFDTLEHVGRVRCPVLVLHSPQDEIVPFEMGRKLFAAAPGPKQFVELRGDHNGGFLISGELYAGGLRDFLNVHFPAQP